MEVKQIAELVNNMQKDILGEQAVAEVDLQNVIDVGKTMLDATDIDNFTKKLVDHVGRVIFVNRPYEGVAPSVLMDGWEYGSVCEKISADIPEAEENESWNLVDQQEYSPNKFYQPKVEAKFFNKKVTFEVPRSFTENQVKSAFSNMTQLNGFLSMLQTTVENSMSIKLAGLIMRTIDNFIGETLNSRSEVRAVNLLKLYNEKFGTETPLKANEAIYTPAFIRFASFIINTYIIRLRNASKLFNIGGKERFTPKSDLHLVMLNDFYTAAGAYLQSDTFNEVYTALPNADTVPYWQGSGTGYTFDDISAINVKISSDGTSVSKKGILACMFDRNALGVANLDKRVTTYWNPKAEFFNNWYKMDAGYFNDLNENFVVFYVEDAEAV